MLDALLEGDHFLTPGILDLYGSGVVCKRARDVNTHHKRLYGIQRKT